MEGARMITTAETHPTVSPMRLMEMLSDRFGAFEAIASSTIKLARFVPEDELPMELGVAEAVMEFASDLRSATAASGEWAKAKGFDLAGQFGGSEHADSSR
jgi:hypothetical protein